MAFCEVESDIDRDFDFGVASDDGFSMNLMANENITWTVERERGISFDLTALTDPDSESRHPESAGGGNAGAFLDGIRREVKLEAAESGVKETTFGHPFGGQFRPQPRPAPPSPFSRGSSGLPSPANKRMLPPSFDLRAPSAAKKRQQQQHQQPWDSGAPQHQQEQDPTPPRALGRTRSRSVRPSAVAKPPAASAAAGASTTAGPGRNKSGGGGSGGGSRVKVEAAEARRSATASAPRRRHVGGIDTMALTAELGLVDSRRRCGVSGTGGGGRHRNSGAGSKGPPHRVGAYTLEERAILVAKFHAKRGRRIWRKKIKYSCRKKLADKRPRLKGRFVTQEELEGLDKETLAKVTGLGPWPDEASDADEEAGEASDSGNSECFSGPAAASPAAAAGTGRYRGGAGGAGDKDNSAESPPRKKAKTTKKTVPLCTAVAAAAAAAASAVKPTESLEPTLFVGDEDEEEEEELDLEDGGSSTSAISSEDSASVYGAEEDGGGGGGMDRVSSSCKVSDMFAVRTDADMEADAEEARRQHHPREESYEEEDDGDSEEVVVDEFEPTDPVFGFMVDDVLSSNFNIVPGGDLEGMSAGVAVS